MKKLVFIFLILIPLLATSQDEKQDMKKINSIKIGKNYIYAEATNSDYSQAFNDAKALLDEEISSWANNEFKKNDPEMVLTTAEQKSQEIKTRRGSLYRVFLYVNKKDIKPMDNIGQVMIVPLKKDTTAVIPVSQVEEVDEQSVQNDMEKQLLALSDYDELVTMLENFIKEGKYSRNDYGKFKTMPVDVPCYLVVYNRVGKLPAVLYKEGRSYINLRTRLHDDITNYRGCGALWIKLK